MTVFPKNLDQGAENISESFFPNPSGQPAGAPDDLPVDDLARDLAEGESILTDSSETESLAADNGSDDLAEPALLALALRSYAPLGVSMGQATTEFASFATGSEGLFVQAAPATSGFVNSGFGDCGCPMCGGGAASAGETVDYSDPDAAPGAAASLTTLANYLRVGYWTDTGRNSRWYNVTNSGTGANNGTLHYNVTGTPSGGITVSSGTYTDTNGISAARQQMVRDAFAFYSELLGITFVETTSTGTAVDFFFIDNQSGAFQSAALHSGTGGAIDHSIINVNSGWQGGESDINGYTYQTFLHEIGHALGLGHQGNYNAGQGTPSYANSAIWANDGWAQSIMSYWDQAENTEFSDDSVARLIGPSAADFIALNALYNGQGYGINNAFNGDTVYGVGTNITAAVNRQFNQLATLAATNAFTLVDADGIDTVDFSNYNVNQDINLTVTSASNTRSTLSSVGGLTKNMMLAAGTIIENATSGGGNDTLTGNQYANTLDGGAGNDIIYGGNGIDSLLGGDGNDTIYGGNEGDTIKGGAGNDWLVGDAGNDYLKGGAGNDTLFGGSGVDTLQGDDGDDRVVVYTSTTMAGAGFYGGNGLDTFEVNGSGIFDLRSAAITGFEEIEFYANGQNSVKTVRITGAQAAALGPTARIDGNNNPGSDDNLYIYLEDSGTTYLDMSGWIMQDWVQGADNSDFLWVIGGAAGENVFGTSRHDFMSLNAGNDTADGGAGADTLKGGGGNDSLSGGTGNDTLYGDDNNDTLDGGAGSDYLYGGLGNDQLYGGGGTDTLEGGGGNDTLYGGTSASASQYYGDDGDDWLYKKTPNGGNEGWYGGLGNDWLVWEDATATSSNIINLVTGRLISGIILRDVVQGIENVWVQNAAGVVGDSGANSIWATGDFANVLDGGAGNDTLKGGGGNDTLYGGLGVDLVSGDDGDDMLHDGDDYAGADSIYGGNGNDTLVKQSWTSSVIFKDWHGGAGTDTLDWTHTTNVIDANWVVNLAAGRILYQGGNRDFVAAIENVIVRHGAGIVGDAQANVLTAVGEFNNVISGGGGDDVINGGGGNDNLAGDDGNDYIDGGTGNDTLTGGLGDDSLYGGIGNDNLSGGDGNDYLYGVDGNNTMTGGAGLDVMYGGFGNDDMDGGADNDSLFASSGNDTVYGGAGVDTLDGWDGDDILFGGSDADLLLGFTGNDTLYGGQGIDTLFGEDGNDLMIAFSGEGYDHFHGGNDIDTVDLQALGQAHNIDLSAGTYSVGTNNRNMTGIEVLYMGGGADTIQGSFEAETIFGGGGTDLIRGGGGADVLYGGVGNDTLYSGAGAMHMQGDGGNDVLHIDADFVGSATVWGGNGTDTLNLSAALDGVTVDLAALFANGISFSISVAEVENVVGSGFADVITGNDSNNQLRGGNGNDSLFGGVGADTLSGEAGADRLEGGGGNDVLSGGVGNDTVYGGVGNDVITGDNGNDVLYGDGGNDQIDGGGGNDTIYGGPGTDTLTGGAGNDVFVFVGNGDIGLGATSDRILDFTSGADKIDLSAHPSNLVFIGTNSFSNTAGEVRYYSLGGVGYLAGDTTGNGIANFEIVLINGAAVVAGDLIL